MKLDNMIRGAARRAARKFGVAAEDIQQDLWVEVLKAKRSYRPEAPNSFETYVYKWLGPQAFRCAAEHCSVVRTPKRVRSCVDVELEPEKETCGGWEAPALLSLTLQELENWCQRRASPGDYANIIRSLTGEATPSQHKRRQHLLRRYRRERDRAERRLECVR